MSDMSEPVLFSGLSRIGVNVGSDADVASASGSVHGKLKDVKKNASSAKPKMFQTYFRDVAKRAHVTTNSYTLGSLLASYPLVNVTGAGKLHYAVNYHYTGGSVNVAAYFRITIDGVVYLAVSNVFSNSNAPGKTTGIVVRDDLTLVENSSLMACAHEIAQMKVYNLNYDTSNIPKAMDSGETYVHFNPIPFSSSLKIESYAENTQDSYMSSQVFAGYELL